MTTALHTHGRISVERFLAFAGWTLAPGASRAALEVALGFYQDRIPRERLIAPVRTLGPWTLPRTGAVRLCELMQAIDFTRPVRRRTLRPPQPLVSFRPRHEPLSPRPRGNWFTPLSSTSARLAIPAEQDRGLLYRVTRQVEALQSTASDAFTWTPKTEAAICEESLEDRYFRGGSEQFFIWDAADALTLLGSRA